MSMDMLKMIISICTGGSVMGCTPEYVEFQYSDHIIRDKQKVDLHKAGFNTLTHGNTIKVMIPA